MFDFLVIIYQNFLLTGPRYNDDHVDVIVIFMSKGELSWLRYAK